MFRDVRAQLQHAFSMAGIRKLRSTGGRALARGERHRALLDGSREARAAALRFTEVPRRERADQLRDQLVRRGTEAVQRLKQLEKDVQSQVDKLIFDAEAREHGTAVSGSLAAFTLNRRVIMAL